MGFIGIFLLALSQAMDAVAAAATAGVTAKDVRARDIVVVGAVFGGFQGVMPAIGYGLGALIGPAVAAVDHWIASGLLIGLGLLTLRKAIVAKHDEKEGGGIDVFGARRLFVLGVATSIDAFTVGVTLPMIGAPLLESCLTIGVVTAVLSSAAVVVGRKIGAAFGDKMEVIGALVLIGMGGFILVDHLRA